MLVLTTSSAVAQALTVLASFALTRIYSPDAYGLLGVVATAAGYINWLGGLRYDTAMVVTKRRATAAFLLTFCLTNSLVVGAVLLLGAVLFAAPMAAWLGVGANLWAPAYVAALFLANVLPQALRNWHVREGQFGRLARCQYYSVMASLGCQFGLAWAWGATGGVLLFSSVIAGAAAAWALAPAELPQLLRQGFRFLRGKPARTVLKHYRNFPLFSVPYSMVSGACQTATVLLFSHSYGLAAVGLFNVARRVSYLPVSLVLSNVQVVFFQKAAAEKGRASLESAVHTLLRVLILAGAPAVFLVFPYLETIFGWVFGRRWSGAGAYCAWLLLPSLATALTSWMDRLYDIHGKQRQTLLLGVIGEGLSLVLMLAARAAGIQPLRIIQIYSISTFAYAFVWTFFTFRMAGFSLTALARNGGLLLLVLGMCAAINEFCARSSLWFLCFLVPALLGGLAWTNRATLALLFHRLRPATS